MLLVKRAARTDSQGSVCDRGLGERSSGIADYGISADLGTGGRASLDRTCVDA